jgi:predicted RNA-binding Zn ribbon-like protein
MSGLLVSFEAQMHPDLHIHVAGDPALDFVNTVAGHRAGEADDRLQSYDDLLEWSRSDGLIEGETARRLSALAEARPGAAARVMDEARTLRESLHGVLSALGGGKAPDSAELTVINRAVGTALSHAAVAPAGSGVGWSWTDADQALAAPLWPVARAAAEQLTSGGYGRMKECASDTCGWLFLDLSKNRSRRWCDMRGCGNRSKVRRHRAKRSAQPG